MSISQLPAVARLRAARLYVVSGEGSPADQATTLCRAIDGGADVVQLRNKGADKGPLLDASLTVAAYARARGVLFVVNDHLDVAMASGADGIHVGQDDLSPATIEALWPGHVVGCSTHTLEQARAAELAGATYIGVGPVFATPTKPGRPAVGPALVTEVARVVRVPAFAIGGIDDTNLDQVLEAGAVRVAVVRAVCSAPDPANAARHLRQRIVECAAVPAA